MKIRTTKGNLEKALKLAGTAISSAAVAHRPILANILLRTEGKRLRVSATDMHLYITAWFDGEIDEPGQVAVPATRFKAHVLALTEDLLSIDVNEKRHSVEIRCGADKSDLRGIDPSGYPPVPEIPKSGVEVEARLLRDALVRVLPAAAKVNTPQLPANLAAVNFTVVDGELRLIATNRNMFASDRVALLPESKAVDGTTFTVGVRLLEILLKEIGNEPGRRVIFSFEGKLVALRYAHVELVAHHFAETYPDVLGRIESLVSSPSTLVTADRKEMMDKLKLAQTVLDKEDSLITLAIDPSVPAGLSVFAVSKDHGKVDTQMKAQMSGDAVRLLFNPGLLLSGLNCLESDNVALGFSGPTAPLRMTAEKSETHYFIIAPMRPPAEENAS